MAPKVLGSLLAAVIFSACATGPDVPGGFLFNSIRGPNVVGTGTKSSKHGKACAMNVLYVAGWGDNSIAAAKHAGGISKVSVVDYDYFDVLGIYTSVCTLVAGE